MSGSDCRTVIAFTSLHDAAAAALTGVAVTFYTTYAHYAVFNLPDTIACFQTIADNVGQDLAAATTAQAKLARVAQELATGGSVIGNIKRRLCQQQKHVLVGTVRLPIIE